MQRRCALVFALLLAASAADSTARQERSTEAYRRLPLSFEINRGQADADVLFLARGSGYTLLLTPSEAARRPLWPADGRADLG